MASELYGEKAFLSQRVGTEQKFRGSYVVCIVMMDLHLIFQSSWQSAPSSASTMPLYDVVARASLALSSSSYTAPYVTVDTSHRELGPT